MKNLVRTLLVWLLLLAIPFQGLASAAMLTCAHDAGAAWAPVIEATAAADMPPSGHCHDGDTRPAAMAAMAAHADQPAHAEHGAANHDHDSRCSACAACCMGAAMAPAPVLAAAPAATAQLRVPCTSDRPMAVDLAQPERPPRPSLA